MQSGSKRGVLSRIASRVVESGWDCALRSPPSECKSIGNSTLQRPRSREDENDPVSTYRRFYIPMQGTLAMLRLRELYLTDDVISKQTPPKMASPIAPMQG
jgi:hypothetical protein